MSAAVANGHTNHSNNVFLNNLIPHAFTNGKSFAPVIDPTESLINNFQNFNHNSSSSSSSNPNMSSIVSLKELVESYAYKFFKENEKEYHRKLGKSYGWKELVKEIDWKCFKIKHEPVQYQEIETPGKPKSHVLFRSTFINDTDKEQDYQLRAERRTVSSCNIEIFEGFVSEAEANLSLEVPLPGCVLSAGTGFKNEYTLENSTSRNIEEEMNWSVESNIKIPSMSKTTAELLVQEDQFKGVFEIKTYFSGELRIKLFKDSQELLIIELGDLDDIFVKEKGFRKDQRGLYRITRGECKARFGIEQKVELHQSSLKAAK